MREAATIEDIGRELGVSAMTVSRALNGHPHVKEETRERVRSVAARLNYRPNRWARSLATRKSRLIGIVIPDITHSFFSEITRAVQDTLEESGYDLMLCHSSGNPERERIAIETLLSSRVDGLLIASSRRMDDPGIFLELEGGETPFVLMDRYFDDLECARVLTDDFAVGMIATRHLIDLGHTKIAHLRGPGVSTGALRYQGFSAAMQAAKLAVHAEWVVEGDFKFDTGYAAMQRLLSLPVRPTAVFAGNDPAALGANRACRDAGLSVPGDISIVGAGSIEGSYHADPFLTTVEWSRRELGEQAARLLIEAIDGKTEPVHAPWICAPSLLVRQSTAQPLPCAAVKKSTAKPG